MKSTLLSSIAAFAITLASFSAFAQSPTVPALGFNVFLEDGARLVTNETEGPMALGGDLTVAGGYQVSINNPGSFYVSGVRVTLVVGGKINYVSGLLQINQNGYIKIGNCIGSTVWYQDPNGAYPPIRITPNSSYDASPRINMQASANTLGVSAAVNPVCQSNVIDFASAFVSLRANAVTMSSLTDNAYLTNSGGTVIPHTGLPSQVKITLNPGLNVLNLTGAELNHMNELTFNNSPDASRYLVVNVNAAGAFTWNVYNSGGIGFSQCPYILYNFYNTTALTIAGYGAIKGTVFAPNASISKTSNMANVEGQVIAKSYHHAGGENHYAVFAPSIPGCGTVTPTSASYTINSNNQCLVCNSFEFTSTSTGGAPLAYMWTFGDGTTSTLANPVKVYSATGTFNVKLKVTGPGGADSTTQSVVVSGDPAHGFTVNDTIQELTGNSFTFTSTLPTFGNIYSWSLGDGSFSTVPNPVITYTAAGIYTVTQHVTGSGGCSVGTTRTVVVESDGVGGGGGGGLESESMGDLISKREYAKIKHSIAAKPNNSLLPIFNKQSPFAAAKTSAATSSLEKYIPAALDASTTPKISTPTDLTAITYAVDVFSVDYIKNDISKAVVLAITTTGRPYNHTKSICDRFRGATLISTEKVKIDGLDFIRFALQQEDGHIEHSIAFAVGKANNGTQFKLQSKWLISEYAPDDSVFNFQVWSTTPENTEKLTHDIISNLKTVLPIVQTDNNFILPNAYIAHGSRNKQFLDINIVCTRPSNNAKVVFIQRINEVAAEDSLIIPFNLAAGDDNHFSIPIYDGYEYEGHFYVNDSLVDDVYMADGGWSLDFDKQYTEILNYKPNNNTNRIYLDNEFPLYRSVQVVANTYDYISIYKFIKAGQEKVDLSAFHSYKFYAKGTGKMEILLIKESVENFKYQYKMVVDLDPAGKNYQISFDDFVSDRLSAPFDPSDVKAVVYNFDMKGVATEFNFLADEQSFSPTEVSSFRALSSKMVTLSPNPATSKFQIKFASEIDRDLDLTLTDLTGKLVSKQTLHATTGQNTFDVQLPAGVPQTVLLVQLGNEDVKYGMTKLSIVK
jgi:choice-of-anchor A domain-containing protein